MKTYFSHINADYWTAKNNAQKLAQVAARQMDHLLINEGVVKDFLNAFEDKIQAINQANKRCKPLELYTWKPEETLHVKIDGVFSMSLYEVKKVYIVRD
jgi:hypothetical protein